ncbi:MAG: cation:proton antiporter, partial [Desulfurococcales archaeon]|nr:cation:proton antiporter [Desulfurococcales archaeon]
MDGVSISYLVFAALLTSGFLIGLVVKRASLSPAIGYLLAGLVLGYVGSIPPEVLGVLKFLSEVSILLLFFEIGFEIHLTKLTYIRGFPLYVSLLEAGLAVPMAVGFSLFLGFGLNDSLVLGLIASFSSTVFTYKLLEERKVNAEVKRVVLMVAAVEDVLIVTALTLLRGGNAHLQIFILESIALSLAVFFLSLEFSKHVLSRVISPDEGGLILMISYCLVLGLGTSYLGLNSALGAFIAGLTMSILPQASKIMPLFKPVRAVFITLFFISMGLNISAVHMSPYVLAVSLAAALALTLTHAVTATASSLIASGLGVREGLKAGFYLSTVSELAMVIAYYGAAYGGCSDLIMPIAAMTIVLGALTGSYLTASQERLIERLTKSLGPERISAIDRLSERFRSFVESPMHTWVQDVFKTALLGVGEFLLAAIVTYVLLTETYIRLGLRVFAVVAISVTPVVAYILIRLGQRMGRAVDRLVYSLGDSSAAEVGPIVKETLYAGIWIITLEVAALIAIYRYMGVLRALFGDYLRIAAFGMTAGPALIGGVLVVYATLKRRR